MYRRYSVCVFVCIYTHAHSIVHSPVPQIYQWLLRTLGEKLVIYYKILLKEENLGYTILLHVAVPNCFWTHNGLWHQYKGKERVITKALSNLVLQRLIKNLGFTFFYFFVDFSIYHFVSFVTEKWKTILFFLHLYKVEWKINISTSASLNLKYYSLPNKKVTFLCKLIWSIILFAFKILYFVCIKF